MSSLILLFIFFYIVLAKINLRAAVCLILAGLPLYLVRFNILSIPFTLLEAMILSAFTVWILENYKEIIKKIKFRFNNLKNHELKIVPYPFGAEIILLLLISYAAAALSGFSYEALGIFKAYFFEPALLFILLLNVFKPKSEGLSFPGFAFALSAFAVSAFAIFQKFTGRFIANDFWAASATRRVTSFFEYPNAVGLFLAPLILLMAGYLFYLLSARGNGGKIFNFQFSILKICFLLTTIILSILAICFARSEGALFGLLAGFGFFGLLAGKKIRWIAVALSVTAVAGVFSYTPARNYTLNKIALKDLSGEIRKQQWRETWRMMSSPKKIILGTGLSGYQRAIAPYHQPGIFFNKDSDPDFRRKIVIFDDKYKDEHWQPVEIYLYPHNIILNFWTELGAAGALLFIWIIGKFFVIGFKNLKQTRNAGEKYLTIGLICAMISIIAHGLVDVPYFKNDLSAMFWIFIAMAGLLNLKLSRGKA